MVGDPVESGVREHEIERFLRRKLGDIAALEGDSAARMSRRLFEHRGGRIDPERRRGANALVQDAGQRARAAAEVHRTPARDRCDEGEQVLERPPPLGREPRVQLGVPAVRAHR